MERRLGRGLGGLLAGSTAEPAVTSGGAVGESQVGEIALASVRPNPFQPRKEFDPAGLEELISSIRQHGLLQPIVVRARGDVHEIVSGERRFRAFRALQRSSIPAVVRADVSDAQMLELALVENLQRRDLDVMERAQGFRRMQDELHLTQEQVAERVGLQRSTVANHLRLLELPEPAQRALVQGLIQMGHARALLGVKDPAAATKLLERVVREDLSVRDVEALARPTAVRGESGETAEAIKTVVPAAPWVRDLEGRMREFLGTKVQLKNGPGYRGQIVIDYYQREDLEKLAQVLAPRDSVR